MIESYYKRNKKKVFPKRGFYGSTAICIREFKQLDRLLTMKKKGRITEKLKQATY